jgi:hypothetical protein
VATPSEAPLPSAVHCQAASCHYDDITLSFDYPAAWRAASFPVVSSFSNDLVYLSTSPLSDPCDRTANSVACVRLAARSLGSNGLLVTWRASGFPNWSFDPNAGQALSVDGRRATLAEFDAAADCRAIGGVRELQAIVPRPTESNWMEMDACLAGPDPSMATTEIEAMLSTVHWKD